VNSVVHADRLDAEVARFTSIIVARSHKAVTTGKRAFYRQIEQPIASAYALTAEIMSCGCGRRDRRLSSASHAGLNLYRYDECDECNSARCGERRGAGAGSRATPATCLRSAKNVRALVSHVLRQIEEGSIDLGRARALLNGAETLLKCIQAENDEAGVAEWMRLHEGCLQGRCGTGRRAS
jgi:hypothetical protein